MASRTVVYILRRCENTLLPRGALLAPPALVCRSTLKMRQFCSGDWATHLLRLISNSTNTRIPTSPIRCLAIENIQRLAAADHGLYKALDILQLIDKTGNRCEACPTLRGGRGRYNLASECFRQHPAQWQGTPARIRGVLSETKTACRSPARAKHLPSINPSRTTGLPLMIKWELPPLTWLPPQRGGVYAVDPACPVELLIHLQAIIFRRLHLAQSQDRGHDCIPFRLGKPTRKRSCC